MKRFWIGICVLVILLAAGLGVTVLMRRTNDPIQEQLILASQAALAENWAQATALFEDARARWEDWSDAAPAFIDHSLLETADGLFAEIRIYGQAHDSTAFAAGCAQLSQLIRTITESQSPSWQNFLCVTNFRLSYSLTVGATNGRPAFCCAKCCATGTN